MASHEEKQCPRCHTSFECKCGTIELCQCYSVTLNESHHVYINARYDDCLCATCLTELRSEYNVKMHEQKISSITMR